MKAWKKIKVYDDLPVVINACQKSFVTNCGWDFGLLLGIFCLKLME